MTVKEREAQRTAALKSANQRRIAMAGIRSDLRKGSIDLASILNDPPADLEDTLLVDLLRWAAKDRRAPSRMTALGRKAVNENINLLLPISKASIRTRSWVIDNGSFRLHRRAA